MSRRWAWGSADCATSAWAVFARWHGFDPKPPLAYGSREESDAILSRLGGMIGMAQAMADARGLSRSPGRAWDIGTDGRTMVVCIGSAWVGKTVRGFGAIRGPILAAWR